MSMGKEPVRREEESAQGWGEEKAEVEVSRIHDIHASNC